MTGTRGRHVAERERGRLGRSMRLTLPFVLASAMTVSFDLTGPVHPATAAPKKPAKPKSNLGNGVRTTPAPTTADAAASPTARAIPASHKVAPGDTVASIAQKYGIATASLLAANGLGWKSQIFPGQVLKLASTPSPPSVSAALRKPDAPLAPRPAAGPSDGRYTIRPGDTLARLADRFGVTVQALMEANGLTWSSILYPGLVLEVPDGAPGAAVVPEAPVASPPPAPKPKPEPKPVVRAPQAKPRAYTVQAGDTISAIAARYGVSVNALLAANGLSPSSIIYPGQKLVIPSGGAGGGGGIAPAGSVTPLTAEQTANARIIIQVGRQLGVPDYGIIIALATAMQESSLRNIPYGDRDSVGLFQQRPSAGWGTVAEIMDPYHATYLFFHGRAGYTRGLLDIPGWQSMPLTVAAQKVQVSAYPNAYAKWETSARAWFAALA